MRDPYPLPLRPAQDALWPPSWRESYHYDCVEVWEERLRRWDRSVGYAWSYANRRKCTIDAVLAAFPPPGRVLDLAAAQGNFTATLASLGYHVVWNDLRAELADYARLKLAPDARVDFLAGNIFELGPQFREAFDIVLALEVIEHVAHPDAFAAKLAELVRPGGAIVMSTPNGGYMLNGLPRFSDCADPSQYEAIQFKPNSDGHIFLLYEDEIRRFAAQAGLEVSQFDLITNPLTAGHLRLRHLLSVLPDRMISGIETATQSLPRWLSSRIATQVIAVLRKPSVQTKEAGSTGRDQS